MFLIMILIEQIILSILVSLLCGFSSVFTSISRSEFLIIVVTHAVLAGVSAIVYLNWLFNCTLSLWFGMIIIPVITCLVILRIQELIEKELILSIIFAVTLAIAVLFMSIIPDYLIPQIWNCLIGNILLITYDDILLIGILTITSLLLYILMYRKFILISFDLEYAQSLKINTKLLHYLLMIVISITAIVCTYVIGLFMTYALMLIPANTFLRIFQYRITVTKLVIICIIEVFLSLVISLILSYYTQLPPSALCGLILCIIALVITGVFKLRALRFKTS